MLVYLALSQLEFKDKNSEFLVWRRIQIIYEEDAAFWILAYEAWVSTLLAQEAHKASHEGVFF